MFHKWLSICIVCLIITGCMAKPSSQLEEKAEILNEKKEPPEEYVPKTVKLVALGDSLTQGVGDESKQGGYVGRIEEMLEEQEEIKDVLVSNYGVNGYQTSNLLQKLKEEEVFTSLKDADMILMTIGGNDMMHVVQNNVLSLDFEPFRNEKKNYEDRFEDILSTIRKYNSKAPIIYIGLYNPFKYMLPELPEIDTIIDEWNFASQQILTNDENAFFVSVDEIFSKESDESFLYKDKFHPNERGYSLIAVLVHDTINDKKLLHGTKNGKE